MDVPWSFAPDWTELQGSRTPPYNRIMRWRWAWVAMLSSLACGQGTGRDDLGNACDGNDDCSGQLYCNSSGRCEQCEEDVQCDAIMLGGRCVENSQGVGRCEFDDPGTGPTMTAEPGSTTAGATTEPTSSETSASSSSTSSAVGDSSSTGDPGGGVVVDDTGCATGVSGLVIEGRPLDVTFRHANWFDTFDTEDACNPGVVPTYLGDLAGGTAAANAIIEALNTANPVPTCVAEHSGMFPGGDAQFVIPTLCATDPAGLFTRLDGGAWALREDIGEAQFAPSSLYVFATF